MSALPEMMLNPNLHIEQLRVGNEQTPVIVIDDVLDDVSALREYASSQTRFHGHDTAYPGQRGALPMPYVKAIINQLYPLLIKAFEIPHDFGLKLKNAAFSLVTQPPESLSVLQRLPHFDSNQPYYLAMVHYLQEGQFGGTGFFKHRPTGFETVSEGRRETYIQSGDAFLSQHGDPELRYIAGSDAHYELFHQVDYKPNRLVIYPGKLLHSALVEPDRDIDRNPHSGRLTANFFMEFVKKQ